MTDTTKAESLHARIMRLPCTPPKDANINQMLAYKSGHRDARHAAAEQAAAHEAEQAGPRPAISSQEQLAALLNGVQALHEISAELIAECVFEQIPATHNGIAASPAQQPVADNARLAEALTRIAKIPGDSVNYHPSHMSRIAREAVGIYPAPGDTAAPEQAEQDTVKVLLKKLSRTPERWSKLDPQHVSRTSSQAAVYYLLRDAQQDIATQAAALEASR